MYREKKKMYREKKEQGRKKNENVQGEERTREKEK